MVDEDRLDELIGGSSSDDSSGSSRTTSKSKDKEMTKQEKMDHLKPGNSSSSGKRTADGGETEDVKKLLFCLANMDASTRIVKEYDFPQFDGNAPKIKESFASDISGEIVTHLGTFGVRDVCDKYGYQWKNVISAAVENQDYDGSSIRTNSGNVKKSDVEDLLKAIASCLLFIEGSYRGLEDENNRGRKAEVRYVISKAMYNQFTTFIKRSDVQRISEKYGFDWQSDIIEKVLMEKDYDDRVKR